MTFLSQLQWRNATKSFDLKRPVEDQILDQICGAIRYAPSSYGLQPFYVKVVKDKDVRERLKSVGFGQEQFSSATAILVFVARTDILNRIDEMIEGMSGGESKAKAKLQDFENMLKGFGQKLNEDSAKVWAQKQCYIALGFGLAACAELGISSCPMEGFSPEGFNEVLGLPKGDYATVVLAVGHAHPDFKPFPKFRYPESDILRRV